MFFAAERSFTTKLSRGETVPLGYLLHPQRLGDGFVDHRCVEQGLLGRERSVDHDLLLGRNVQRHVRLQPSQQERS